MNARKLLPVVVAGPEVCEVADAAAAYEAARRPRSPAARASAAQYYIWHNDMSGTLLFGALCRAADRGEHVRLLLDDDGTFGLDTILAALNAYRYIEVRLTATLSRPGSWVLPRR